MHTSSSDLDKEKIIYVFGHQASDTDTLCSSIIPTNLQKEMASINQVIECGLILLNKELKFTLEYFGFQPQL